MLFPRLSAVPPRPVLAALSASGSASDSARRCGARPRRLAGLLAAATLLSACSSAPETAPPEPVSVPPNPQLVMLEAAAQRADAQTPAVDPMAAFYADVAPCDGGFFRLRDLMVGTLRISNNSLGTIAASLAAMGYNVMDLQQPAFSGVGYACQDLPVVTVLSQPADMKVSFGDVVTSVQEYGQVPQPYGQPGGYAPQPAQMPAAPSSLDASPNASELDRFLVYYHPEQQREFDKLQWLVANKLDEPSAQVYIEAMVLEVRDEDSSEFGVEFEQAMGDRTFGLGTLTAGEPALSFLRNTIRDPETGLRLFNPGEGFRVELKALIEEGKAEVLSRPSVLAVSNRQALIQVVDIIQTPIVSSTLTEFGGLQISSYSFEPLPIGITLNLKPRVSADRKWLTLEIDATVDAEDDENSGAVFADSEDGQIMLAEKQGSNSKKVRTFARVPDRTPIIIGGLVGKNSEQVERKVPILGDLPLLGKLFTSTDDEYQKREIIIVLTPYILAEDGTSVSIRDNQPSDAVRERALDSLLFEEGRP